VTSVPELLIVADDLSGAADSAAALAGRAEVVVLLDAAAPLPPAAVVAVDTDSRYAEPAEAGARAAAAIGRGGLGTLVYKKIDSTLRGNIGPEVRACLSALADRYGRRHLAVVAPAFPAAGRTVLGGRVLVDGEPVEARHPGRVPLLAQLAAAGLTVRVLGLEELRAGDPAALLAAAAGAVDAVVVDAETPDDLALTAAACADLPVLPVGSAGLAHHLFSLTPTPTPTSAPGQDVPAAGAPAGSATNASAGEPASAAPGALAEPVPGPGLAAAPGPSAQSAAAPVDGPVLTVVGSRSERAYAQCRLLADALPAVPVAVREGDGDGARAAGEVRDALGNGRDTVLFLDPQMAVQPSRAREFAAALGRAARAGLDEAGALVATGGETARAVLLAAGVPALLLDGEPEPGVVRARTPKGLVVVTKAGAFGDDGTLLRAVRALHTAPGPHSLPEPVAVPEPATGSPAPLSAPWREPTMSQPVIAITMGDAAGVGPEVIVKALAGAAKDLPFHPFVVGDAARLRRAIDITGVDLTVRVVGSPEEALWLPGTVECLDLANIPQDLPFGELSPVAGEGAYRYIEAATELASQGRVDAICTAPLNKEALHAAGHKFPGHTELLAQLTGTPEVSMLLSAPKLRVIHVTTHIGLVDAVARIEPGLVERTIRRGHATLVAAGVARPRIAVCGINPHAGENGLFGHGEEEDKVVPAIEKVRADGIDALGPLPADTVFFRAVRGDFDLVVAMYHDQGHGPVKVLGLDAGVNITVGLPVIRTSVDHGTAFDIAGTGRADEASMVEALRQAVELAPSRGTGDDGK
jgi:4-hydroxythreonine-4-phosphate dehydrogenase